MCSWRKGQGWQEQGWCDISYKSTPLPQDPNVHMVETSSQPRTPPSQGENPTSGEHLDQTTAMKGQHQTRVSKRPSPQARLQEKLQSLLLEAFKRHRTPLLWDHFLVTGDRCPQVSLVGFDYRQRERVCVT